MFSSPKLRKVCQELSGKFRRYFGGRGLAARPSLRGATEPGASLGDAHGGGAKDGRGDAVAVCQREPTPPLAVNDARWRRSKTPSSLRYATAAHSAQQAVATGSTRPCRPEVALCHHGPPRSVFRYRQVVDSGLQFRGFRPRYPLGRCYGSLSPPPLRGARGQRPPGAVVMAAKGCAFLLSHHRAAVVDREPLPCR